MNADALTTYLAELASVTAKPRQPTLAIIIPVYKHSVLIVDALACALSEAQHSQGCIVIVNDGCPFPETHETCLTFAHAYPGYVEYIKALNGGLSAARNRGIRHALARFPSVETIYLLDADNRLSSGAMRRTIRHMADTCADWVYPNIDKFGMEWSGDYTAPYSVFRHLFQNVCEAGSLVHRRIFDAGIEFDEQMRQGYEDWEFWLQCADAGFRGVPYGDFGFQYRARRESMVRNSDRSEAEILAYMHRKHKRLYSWKNILRLEHQDAPRFCIIDTESESYSLTSIANESSASGNLVNLDRLFWQSYCYPVHYHFPQFVVIMGNRSIEDCARLCISDWILWQIEDLLETYTVVFVFLKHQEGTTSLSIEPGPGSMDGPSALPHGVATYRKCVQDCALDSQTAWIDTLNTPAPEPSVCSLTISGPFPAAAIGPPRTNMALSTFFSVLSDLRNSHWKEEIGQSWEWRSDTLIPGRDLYLQTRSHMHALGPIGHFALTNENEIAFLVPVVSFGGVEQVAIQVARQFRIAGWRTRLVVTGSSEIRAPERLHDAFDVLCFLNDPPHAAWNPSGYKYYGHDLQKWAAEGRIDRLTGLVAGCAAVFNFQAMHGNEAMGWLRRQGIVTATSLHLIDRDIYGSPEGHPYWMLAYEHAYDFITAPSQQLLNFCSAAGVPMQKLVFIRNAPTFDLDDAVRRRRVHQLDSEDRQAKGNESRPLRVLCMGRLDRQKGVERLLALIQASRDNAVPIEWRVVGSCVLQVSGAEEFPVIRGDADLSIEPPIYERFDIIERLLWADALVLLSHWEGSPLIVLEAQRVGTIPIVTDAGAVSEMIESNVDGIIVPNHMPNVAAVRSALEKLAEFQQNPSLRYAVSCRAMERVTKLDWKSSALELITKLTAEVAKRI